MKDLLSTHGIAFVLLPTLDHCPVETVVKWLSPDKVLFAMRDNLTNTGKFWTDFFNGIGYIMERRLTLTIATEWLFMVTKSTSGQNKSRRFL